MSQTKLDRQETVYNFEVANHHTYHIGSFGVLVHNAECAKFTSAYGNPVEKLIKGGWVDEKTGKVKYIDPFDGKMKHFPDKYKEPLIIFYRKNIYMIFLDLKNYLRIFKTN